MEVLSTDNQAECFEVLDRLGIREVFTPLPGQVVCDGIIQIKTGFWIVGTNNRGKFTLHFLEATKAEAWAFFDALHGGCGHTNQRISICGPSVEKIFSN